MTNNQSTRNYITKGCNLRKGLYFIYLHRTKYKCCMTCIELYDAISISENIVSDLGWFVKDYLVRIWKETVVV